MAGRKKSSNKKLVLTSKTVRKMRASLAQRAVSPLPVDGLKLRVEQQLAKSRKSKGVLRQAEKGSPTSQIGNEQAFLLSRFRRATKRGDRRIYTVLVFEGVRFLKAVPGWEPCILIDGRLCVKVKKKHFPLRATSEYLFIDVSTPASLPTAVSTTADIHDSVVPAVNGGFPSLLELSELDTDELSRNLIAQLAKASMKPSKGDKTSNVTASRSRPVGDQVKLIIPTLHGKTFLQLRQMWLNALRMKSLAQSHDLVQIDRLLESIEAEWQRRGVAGDVSDEDYFRWPSTDAPTPRRSIGEFEVPGYGMLSYLEYHVGRTNGQPTKVRHGILDRVFSGRLPPVFDRSYMQQWGDPGTSHRLQKMAETLAALARNFKRRDDDRLEQAIREWEADLGYLYEKYYVGMFRFAWPATRLR